MANNDSNKCTYSRKDFLSDIPPKWCPGCGDHAVFHSLTTTFSELGINRERFAIFSGIGCSSRFPYYTNTYGFHTIHGRAPTVAVGAKLANPDLSVWIITGDGDALSIGGNHFIHLIRRNPNINIVVLNNEIYGLTKGQVSPTSRKGSITKTTPFGSLDSPIQPLKVALACGGTFLARGIDTDTKGMREIFKAAANHQGISIIEVLVDCVIFNKGVFSEYESRKTSEDRVLRLTENQPLIYGKNKNKGIILHDNIPKAVTIGTNGVTRDDILVHKLGVKNSVVAHILSNIEYQKELPLPLGVIYQVEKPTYEEKLLQQEKEVKEKLGEGDLAELLKSNDSWQVDHDGIAHSML